MTRRVALMALLVGLTVFPLAARAADQEFYITLAVRLMIFALAASSLNLVLGYGGMVSFGHAAFFGIGAYTIAVLAKNGLWSAWVAWPLAVVVAGLLALVIGAICLRTRGVYFIMITLAFAQMLYFIVISMKTYGGEDGLSMPRSGLGMGLDLRDDVTLYYATLVMVTLALGLMYRIVHSRFGRVVQAVRENDARMEALGYPVYLYQLTAFVIGGAFAGLAGALNANLNSFASPNSLAWAQSGHLMMMVILGGVGTFWGGTLGALVFLLVEEVLADFTIHWQLGVGLILLVIVMFAPQGIAGLLAGRTGREGRRQGAAARGEGQRVVGSG